MRLHRLVLYGCLFLALMVATPSFAQESRGSIVGRVTDSSGAVVVGVAVSATSETTGVATPAKSNDQGNYEIRFLPPGQYKVSASMQGFKTWIQKNVELRVNDRIGLDIVLALGDVSENIVVSAETPLLQTATANTGQVIDNRRIADFPLMYGNATTLLFLAPGVNSGYPGGLSKQVASGQTAATTMVSFHGAPFGTSDFMLDGAPNTQTTNADVGMAISINPPTDIVQEFKVETAYDASVGHSSGTVVNHVTKSGTNGLHGTGYLFYRDPALNANSFFGNRSNQAKAKLTFRRWGLSSGGPIVLPRLYNGRNRTFFMYAYEGYREVMTSPYLLSVPTPAQKAGDFSALLGVSSRYQIYDPMTTTPTGDGYYSRQPFTNNTIPSSRISPIAQAISKYWPDPNISGTADGTNNFSIQNRKEPNAYYTHVARVDHLLTPSHHMFGRFAVRRYLAGPYRNRFDNGASGIFTAIRSRNFVIDDVWLASPSTVVNFRYGLSRTPVGSTVPSQGFDLTTLGFSQSLVDMLGFRLPEGTTFPTVRVSGFQALQGESPYSRAEDVHSFIVAIDRVVGQHSLKIGTDARVYREPWASAAGSTPSFSFDASFTHGPLNTSASSPGGLGQGYASMLLGIPTGSVSWADNSAVQSTYYGFYFQDNWRVSSKLTLNLGLRYEYQGPLTERYNRSVRGFDPTAQQTIAPQVQANYAANPIPELPANQFQVRGGLTYAGVGGQPRELYRSGRLNFAPRFGFAYQASKNTVIRGGYGIYFLPTGQPSQMRAIQTGYSQGTSIIPTTDNGQTFIASLANPFPDGIIPPTGNAMGSATNLGQSITFFNVNPSSPYNQRWGLNIQRQLPNKFLVEVGYTGSRSVALPISTSVDGTPSKYLSKLPYRDQDTINRLSKAVANPFYGQVIPGSSLGSSKTIPAGRLLYPYPQFGGMSTTTNQGYSWYHGLMARLERRFAQGFTLLSSYTHSKLMEAVAQSPRSSSYLNWDDPLPYRSVGTSDRPHNFNVSGVYELPFGSKRRFGANSPSVVRTILSGWQVAGMFSVLSGGPLGFGDVIFNGDWNKLALSRGERRIETWFNTSGFERSSAKQLSYHYRTFPLYISGLRADNYNKCDLSLQKNTKIRETVSVQFRAEFLNAFNHPTFSGPNTSPTSTAFGMVSGEDSYPRYIQFGLKLVY